MAIKENRTAEETSLVGRRLFYGPMILVGLTLVLLFVASSDSAWGRHGVHDLEDIKAHAEHFVGRALDRLDATDEQSAAIQTIVAASIDDLQNARQIAENGHRELRRLVLADSIDRAAIEQLRQSHLQRADEFSRIVVDGLADIMNVLTIEQRQKLEAHFDQHHGGHRRHGWGWH